MSKLSKYMDLKLTNLFERAFRKNKDQILKKIVSASSYDYLMNHLSGDIVVPYNTWSISPQGMMVIINHILINNVKTVVEFGTGISTVFLNNLSIKNGLNLKIISIDHDAKWQNTIKEKYKAPNVEYIHSPLNTKMKFKNEEFFWYDPEVLNKIDKQKTDLIIVDAPIGKNSHYERAGAFEFFKQELNRNNFSCFLDDIDQEALKEVMQHYYPNAKFYPGFAIAGSGNTYETEPVIFTK
ncbi:MAG: class I SAM-dependent methyltransferase [Bacteroidetes bacterium]|nr:class I SAM-dependent methyltransferase [Bacteroidota bacterium]